MGIRFFLKKTDPYPYLLRTYSTLILMKYFLSVLKISKILVFFLITSGDYLMRYRDPFSQRIFKNGSCSKIVKYSHDVLKKKTKVRDNFNTDKNVL